MPTTHLFKLSQLEPQEKTEGGFRIRANKTNFPILQGMSLYKLVLFPKGIREPHWHANADELGYCLKGQVLVNIYDTEDQRAQFLVQPGDVFLVPSGALHTIENVGGESAELILCFSSEDTEDFNISSSLSAFTNAVLGNTWGVEKTFFDSFHRSTQSTFATLRQTQPIIPDNAHYASPYHFPLESSEPMLANVGGSVKMARHDKWPILEHQALYTLLLTDVGMREPHWHPETAELGYVAEGRGRMSILSPSGKIDTYVMEEGDLYFIPKAYPHHIENLGHTLHLLIFFDQAMPRDVGFSASIRSNSNEVLASVTQNSSAFFDELHKYYADQFIVKRINPLD